MAFELGDRVRVRMEKWGDRPHWTFEAHWLGRDEHGDWLGIPAGTEMDRPGAHYVAPKAQVGLVPGQGGDLERAFLATFHAPGTPVWVYVDMTLPPVWEDHTVRAVDLDLDVIRGRGGDVVVDDEDEFAEHQVSLGHPPEVVALAETSRDRVLAAVLDEEPPYDGRHEHWLDVLAHLVADGGTAPLV
jgi:hypothetical protein